MTRRAAATAAILGGFLSLSLRVSLPQSPEPLAMQISARKMTIHSGDGLLLLVILKNTSPATIMVRVPFPGQELGTYWADVTDEHGHPAPVTAYGRLSGFRNGRPLLYAGSRKVEALAPGATLRAQIALTSLFDLTTPGNYTVQAFAPEPAPLPPVASNKLLVKVLAP